MIQSDTLIWIGAGTATYPVNVLEAANRVILVEARADASKALANAFSHKDNTRVINAVISAKEADCTFHTMNLADRSAISPPDKILDVFPSLKSMKQAVLTTTKIEQLIDNAQLDPRKNNHLIIDVTDQANSLILALAAQDNLQLFSRIDIQYSQQFYCGDDHSESLRSTLIAHGFELQNIDEEDPDFPLFLFRRSNLWSELNDIKNTHSKTQLQLAHSQDELKKKNITIAELEKHVDSLKATLGESEARVSSQKQLSNKLKADIEALNQENNALAVEQKKALQHLETHIGELKKEVGLKDKLIHDEKQQNLQIKEQLKALENRSKAESSDLEKQLQKLGKEKEQELANLKSELGAQYSRDIKKLNKEIIAVQSKADSEGFGLDQFIKHCEVMFYGKAITYVDIGAYIGSVASKFVNSALRVEEAHLIEPNPETFKELNVNVSSFKKVKKLTCKNLAVSDSSENLTIDLNNSMTRVVELDDSSPRDNTATIAPITLEAVAKQCNEEHISILKIDVEGHEMSVLKSGEKLFRDNKIDLLYIEVGLNPKGVQQTYFKTIDDFMIGYGYRVFKIYEQMHEWIEDSPLLRRMNIAYMSEKFAKSHPYKVMNELYELKMEKNNT